METIIQISLKNRLKNLTTKENLKPEAFASLRSVLSTLVFLQVLYPILKSSPPLWDSVSLCTLLHCDLVPEYPPFVQKP
jgi:hypothetical protein